MALHLGFAMERQFEIVLAASDEDAVIGSEGG